MRSATIGKPSSNSKNLSDHRIESGLQNLAAQARRTNSEYEVKAENKCGPGQPPEPHRFVDFQGCLPAA
jgi:hypothetical protein